MDLSSEIFVLCIFLVGILLFYNLLHNSELPGRRYFFLSMLVFLLSNISTVVEEFIFNAFFNTLEHLSIGAASLLLLVAIIKMTAIESKEKKDRS